MLAASALTAKANEVNIYCGADLMISVGFVFIRLMCVGGDACKHVSGGSLLTGTRNKCVNRYADYI